MTTKTIVIAAAGTGGHIFPAISLAEELHKLDYQIEWIGSDRGMEIDILAKTPYRLHQIAFYGVRHKGILTWLKMPWRLFKTVASVRKKLKLLMQSSSIEHAIVMGGYISVPLALAAKSLGIHLVLHEQNAIPGLANKVISLFANQICEGLQGAFQTTLVGRFQQAKIHPTGNPVRQRILKLQRKKQPDNKNRQILVLGGSLGAQKLNEIIPKSIAELQKLPNLTINKIIHQCGKNRQKQVQKAYDSLNLRATVMDFIDNIAIAYQHTDIIIARAGASTVAEISVLGIPTILIPYPHAVNNHQYFNAVWLRKHQQCILLEEQRLSTHSLGQALETLLQNNTNKPQPHQTVNRNATEKILKVLTTKTD